MIELPAILFDGQTSKAHRVRVQIFPDSIVILYRGELHFSRSQFRALTPMRNCPLIIELEGGARLEIDSKDDDKNQIQALLCGNSRLLYWLETHKVGVATSIIGLIISVWLMIQFGIPQCSLWLANKVPQAWADSADSLFLHQLDKISLAPSTLSSDRQQKLRDFLQTHLGARVQVEFRTMNFPNAFALPGQTIVIGDELIKIMDKDELILAVAFHEQSHLKNRHVLARIISSGALPAFAFLMIGDMVGMTESTFSLGILLISNRYSRDFEREADHDALIALKHAGLAQSCFKEALQNIQSATPLEPAKVPAFFNYLSTHPHIDERISNIDEPPCQSIKPPHN